MLATSLKEDGRKLSRQEIREEVSGVLCRCTGYESIVLAVEDYLNDDSDDVTAPLEIEA